MSMKKWRKLVNEKAQVEQQNDSILTAIKNNKINKEFGQLSGEELFKPITSRLDKRQVEAATKEGKEIPDYGMDEFDLNNPFDEDFKPDEETPPPSPTPTPPSPTSTPPSPPPSPTSTPPSPTSTPLPPLAEEEETELMEESGTSSGDTPQSKWGPPQEPGIKGSESVDLQTLSSMLSKNKDNPGYVVKSKKSKFYGYTMADIKEARDEILDRRKGNKQPGRVKPRSELDWEQEGSGSVDPNTLVEKLHLSLASIQAGNTSLKLKKQVKQMLGLLVSQNEITEKEAHNILEAII